MSVNCGKCGREATAGAAYCEGCGSPLEPGKGPKKRRVWVAVAVVIVVAIIIIAIALAGLINERGQDGALIRITVYNQESQDIRYWLYFEGVLVQDGSLAPSESAQWNETWFFQGGSATAHVESEATIYGGGHVHVWHNETANRGATLNVRIEM
jgi:hypothetical protein